MKLVMNYANADQKFLKTVTVYAKKSDNFIYADSGCTVKIDKDTMMELCTKGLAVVSYEKAFYPVAAFKDNTTKNCLPLHGKHRHTRFCPRKCSIFCQRQRRTSCICALLRR